MLKRYILGWQIVLPFTCLLQEKNNKCTWQVLWIYFFFCEYIFPLSWLKCVFKRRGGVVRPSWYSTISWLHYWQRTFLTSVNIQTESVKYWDYYPGHLLDLQLFHWKYYKLWQHALISKSEEKYILFLQCVLFISDRKNKRYLLRVLCT